MSVKIWVDDVRPAPEGYIWCKSVNEAKAQLSHCANWQIHVNIVDMDHDAGDYAWDGGDYIALLDWMQEYMIYFPIRIHSMNPIGVANMKRLIESDKYMKQYFKGSVI